MKPHYKLNESKIALAFWVGIATGWLVLGRHSDRVPWGSALFWATICAVVAGSAMAVGRYRTVFALRSYVVMSSVVGAIRSTAYLADNSGGPAAVWFLFTLTTLGSYLMYVDRLERRP